MGDYFPLRNFMSTRSIQSRSSSDTSKSDSFFSSQEELPTPVHLIRLILVILQFLQVLFLLILCTSLVRLINVYDEISTCSCTWHTDDMVRRLRIVIIIIPFVIIFAVVKITLSFISIAKLSLLLLVFSISTNALIVILISICLHLAIDNQKVEGAVSVILFVGDLTFSLFFSCSLWKVWKKTRDVNKRFILHNPWNTWSVWQTWNKSRHLFTIFDVLVSYICNRTRRW